MKTKLFLAVVCFVAVAAGLCYFTSPGNPNHGSLIENDAVVTNTISGLAYEHTDDPHPSFVAIRAPEKLHGQLLVGYCLPSNLKRAQDDLHYLSGTASVQASENIQAGDELIVRRITTVVIAGKSTSDCYFIAEKYDPKKTGKLATMASAGP